MMTAKQREWAGTRSRHVCNVNRQVLSYEIQDLLPEKLFIQWDSPPMVEPPAEPPDAFIRMN